MSRHLNDIRGVQREGILALSRTVSEQEGGQKGGHSPTPLDNGSHPAFGEAE